MTDWSAPSAFALELQRSVALRLLEGAADRYMRAVRDTLLALRIMPKNCSTILVEDEVLHLTSDVPTAAVGPLATVETACGQRLTKPLGVPFEMAFRGEWADAEQQRLTRCRGCEAHAAEYPETSEPADAYLLPDRLTLSIHMCVAVAQLPQVHEMLTQLTTPSANTIAAEVASAYEAALIADLTARFRAGGKRVISSILTADYGASARMLERLCADGLPALRLANDDYRRIVTNAIADASQDDGLTLAAHHAFRDVVTTLMARCTTLRR